MRQTVLFCKSGRHPVQCGFKCAECFRHEVRIIDTCDKCGIELVFDEEINLCRNCMKKENIIKEDIVVCHSMK